MARKTVQANKPNRIVRPWGIVAYIKVNGRQRQKTFPLGTNDLEIDQWLLDQQREKVEVARGTLAADVRRFIAHLDPKPGVKTSELVELKDQQARRKQRDFEILLAHWVRYFGPNKRRCDITREQLQEAFNKWEKSCAASTLNKRRQALLSLWNYCDGEDADCPVAKIPKWDEGKPQPRGYDPEVLDRAIASIERCRTKAILLLIRWTGARPCEIERLERSRIHLDADVPYVHYTTGKDGEDRMVPLVTAGALEGARMLLELGNWQPNGKLARYSRESVNKTFKLAVVRSLMKEPTGPGKRLTPEQQEERKRLFASLVEGEHRGGNRKFRLTPYVCRHTCFTELRRAGADLADIAEIAGHKSPQTTKRYAPAIQPKLVDAMRRIDRAASPAPAAQADQPAPARVEGIAAAPQQ